MTGSHPLHGVTAWLAICAFVVGVGSMYWSVYQLREGVRNDRWSAESVAAFRKVIRHPLWNVAMFSLLSAMMMAMAGHTHQWNRWFWTIFLLLQAQTQIAYAFNNRRQQESDTPPLIDWSQVRPLNSQHWGER